MRLYPLVFHKKKNIDFLNVLYKGDCSHMQVIFVIILSSKIFQAPIVNLRIFISKI